MNQLAQLSTLLPFPLFLSVTLSLPFYSFFTFVLFYSLFLLLTSFLPPWVLSTGIPTAADEGQQSIQPTEVKTGAGVSKS